MHKSCVIARFVLIFKKGLLMYRATDGDYVLNNEDQRGVGSYVVLFFNKYISIRFSDLFCLA